MSDESIIKIRRYLEFVWLKILDFTDLNWQDIVEANRSIGRGVDEIDLKIIESIEQKQKARWSDYHSRRGCLG